MPSALSIAHFTPYPLEPGHPVSDYALAASEELARRGHRTVLVAPSHSRGGLREAKRLIRAAREDASALFASDGGVRVLEVGEALPLPHSPRRSARALPVDVARTVEALMDADAFDVVHVHEPWAPSLSASALRHSRALNVGGFHAPAERLISTQVTRRFVELFFGRLDARIASYRATAGLLARHFPADYRVILPGTAPAAAASGNGPARLAFPAAEERSALRTFLRALRRLPPELEWAAAIAAPEPPTALRAEIRDRVSFEGYGADVLDGASLAVFATAGDRPSPELLLRALASGATPVASQVPLYEELVDDPSKGFLYPVRDADTLAAQIVRALGSGAPAGDGKALTWKRAGDELEEVYSTLAARRRDPRGNTRLRSRLAKRRLIDVDLHMHTDHSHDCATPVEVLLQTAKAQGLGAIAVTDHNEISGAKDAAAKAAAFGMKVIVAEEVKTKDQGEVIGLFIDEKIPRGMTLQETIAEIKRQGGLVYVPHPFDRMHAVPDYAHLLDVLDDVDALEVYNARVAIGEFNEEALRFAAKYRIPAGAGSDAHVAQGLGSVRIRMHDFEGSDEFLESLRSAEIIRQPASYLYVQALKFLETRATPPGARRARAARRVKRANRRA